MRKQRKPNALKYLLFFDRYLPIMTEIMEASKHGEIDVDESIERFTNTVKAFSSSLYKVNDVVEINKTVLENMAILDGLYNPFDEAFGVNSPENADEHNEMEIV